MRTLIILSLIALVLLPLELTAVPLQNPIKARTFSELLIGVLKAFLGLLAILATFVFVYGGFLMLTSGGNPELIRKAKETLFWATIGIITVLGSWVFIRWVLETVATSTR